MAALQLSWFKFKHHYGDYLKVLVGILLFQGMILFIQEKEFLKTFETTRMSLFLLLFSSSLLILVQTSIYISKERSILNRDFFSTLGRVSYALATLLMNIFFAIGETLVFMLGLNFFSSVFDKDLASKGQFFSGYWLEVFVTVVLVYLSSHFLALLISSLVKGSEITSVVLAVVAGIVQFSLAGTILQLPKAIRSVDRFIYLSYGHKLFGMTNELEKLPSALEKFKIPIEKSQLDQFVAKDSTIIEHWSMLGLHALVYALCFVLVLRYKKE